MLDGVKHNKSMNSQFTSATCPTCDTPFERLPVEYDEDGSECAALEVRPCADSLCGKLLRFCCPHFRSDAFFCADHLVSVPDGTDRPLHCCPTCAAECEIEALPPVIPPASVAFPVRPAEAA
jgi:hypothetical protein